MKFLVSVLTIALFVCIVNANYQLMIPPFLMGAPESTVQELQELIKRNINKPDFEVEALVEQWANEKGGTIKEKFYQFKADMKLMQERANSMRKAMAQNLSPEARKADEDLSRIGNNKTLNVQQKQRKLAAYLAGN
uniref:SXP/RAL-2 family protein Ani s 5-like cation-binding domain-containing protein n=1 Tax=Setaria digitata TaxID=48799 RepID=A0A915Q1U5_9BILA